MPHGEAVISQRGDLIFEISWIATPPRCVFACSPLGYSNCPRFFPYKHNAPLSSISSDRANCRIHPLRPTLDWRLEHENHPENIVYSLQYRLGPAASIPLLPIYSRIGSILPYEHRRFYQGKGENRHSHVGGQLFGPPLAHQFREPCTQIESVKFALPKLQLGPQPTIMCNMPQAQGEMRQEAKMHKLREGEHRMCISIARARASETQEASRFGAHGSIAQIGRGGSDAWNNSSVGRGRISTER
jgi:hypothetical protein